jgi:hypothetical protein
VGTSCEANSADIPCDGVTCDDHGWCRLQGDRSPTCDCFPDYYLSTTSSLVCVPVPVVPDGGGDADVPDGDGEADGEAEAEGDGDGGHDGDDGDAGSDAPDCGALLGGSCNLVTQCGCPATGFIETCGLLGTQPARTACDATADPCVSGTQCLPLFGEWACEKFCISILDCPAGSDCRGRLFGEVLYGACLPPAAACAPVTDVGCATGQVCRVVAGATLQTYCGTAGPNVEGAACLTAGCASGLACNVGSGGVADTACRKFCRLAAIPSDCTTGTCTDVYLNGSVGLCLP